MQKIIIALSFIVLLIIGVFIPDDEVGESASGFLTSLPPDPPTLLNPADEATHLPDRINVIWYSQIHTGSYNLQVSEVDDFTDMFVNETIFTDTTFSLSGFKKNTTYYWRVIGSNVAGSSEPSPTWKFTTLVALPDAPVLVEPVNDAVNVPIDTDLKWNVVATADFYTLQVSELPDFSTLVIDQTSLTDTLFSASALENNTTYYWRVIGSNVAGSSEPSPTWKFTTLVALPDAPVLVEPVNDAVNVPIDTDLKWNVVATADFYTLQVSESLDFSALVIDQTSLTDTLFSASALENNTVYYWCVSASNAAGEGVLSEVWNFSTSSPTAVDGKIDAIPEHYALLPAYPNPFNPKTTIIYYLPESAEVSLIIYNSMGQFVLELVSSYQHAGEYTVTWDGRNNLGVPVTSGLYFCHFKSGNNAFTQQIMLVR